MRYLTFILLVLISSTVIAQKSAEEYVKMAKEKMLIKDYETALKNLDKAIELDPELASAYRERGIVKFNTEKYSDAISDFNKAIELEDPGKLPFTKKGESYFHRGLSNFKLGNFERAIKDFDIVISIEDSFWRNLAYDYAGASYYEIGNKEMACKYWREGNVEHSLSKNCN